MTQTEVTRAVQFANPISGEVLTLAAPDADLASYLEDLKEFQSVLSEHRRMVERELATRADRAAKWTHTAGRLKWSLPSPAPTEEWNGADLREALLLYVDEGALAIESVDAAVEVEIQHKVKKRGVDALRKLGGEIAQTINDLAQPVEKTHRSVKVERV